MRFLLNASAIAVLLLAPCPASATEAAQSSMTPAPAENALCGRRPLDRVKEVDFNIVFATEKQAIEAAARVDDAIFEVIVRTSAAHPDWLLRAIYRELPSPELRSRHMEEMSALAKAQGGRFQGSGCSFYTYRHPSH